MSSNTYESGQTLIEVLVTFTIGILIIGALAIATIVSIRNTQFAQNQTQATKYAQEELDLVKSIRDRDGSVVLQGQSQAFSDFWNANSPRFGSASANGFSGFFKLVNTPSILQIEQRNTADLANDLTGGIFKRYITIEDDQNYQIQRTITSVVGWSDTAGTHKSTLTTVLTKR